ncbi:hypothetical protein, partial [Zunongwangia profunda]|uniref:hypothetical protein n=1 Tax=Zunongwangia profunda TaxID=398743 RepID=UPI0030D81C63
SIYRVLVLSIFFKSERYGTKLEPINRGFKASGRYFGCLISNGVIQKLLIMNYLLLIRKFMAPLWPVWPLYDPIAVWVRKI